MIGKPTKHKIISRALSYHGTSQGALSITGIPFAKIPFEPLVPGGHKVPNTNFYRAPQHVNHDEKEFGIWAADKMLFGGEIIGGLFDNVVEITFIITGPWSEPIIEKLDGVKVL